MAAADLLIRIRSDVADVKKGVDTVTTQLGKMESVAAKAGGFLGRMFAAVAVGAVVKDFGNATSALVDLSDQTGATVRSLQRLQYAGSLAGVSLEPIVQGIGRMQDRLASLDKSGLSALRQLGLNLDDLRKLDPGAQFEAIATGISKVQDPAQRTAIAMDLFGRSGVTLLPVLRQNLKDVGDEGERLGIILGDKAVAAGDRFDDAVTRLTGMAKGFIGSWVLTPIVDGIDQVTGYIGAMGDSASRTFEMLHLDTGRAAADFRDMGQWIDVVRGKIEAMPAVPGVPTSLAGAGAGAPAPLTGDAALQEANRLTDALDRQRDTLNEAREAARDYAEAQAQLRDASEALVSRGFARMVEAQTTLLGQMPQLRQHLEANRSALLLNETHTHDYSTATGELVLSMQEMIATGKVFKSEGDANILKLLRDAGVETRTWQGELGALSAAMTALSQTGGTALVNGLASVVNSLNVTAKGVTSLKGGFSDLTSGKGLTSILSGFTGIVSGIGGIVSAAQTAIQIGKALFNVFDRNKGRDVVESFADSFGGFDALHRQLNDLGSEGERLWVLLTQGVGRNNPDQAKKAIEAVNAALDAQKMKHQETGVAAALASDKVQAVQAASLDAIKARIGELTSHYDSLFNSIKDEAPEEVMGVVEEATRARMAAVIKERTKTEGALDVLNRKIQEGMLTNGTVAHDTAMVIEEAFNSIRINPIRVSFDVDPLPGGAFTVPAMKHGGIVRKPTLALIGEAGPEAVVPLGRPAGGFGGVIQNHHHIYLEGREVQGTLSSRFRGRYKVNAV